MFLVLDFGNTNKKFALFRGGKMILLKSLRTVSLEVIKKFVRDHPGIEACILSSVIRHPSSINEFLRKQFLFIELNSRVPLPLKNRYRTPDTLGNDRLAAAVAGHLKFPRSPVLVINAGTCLTYELVSARGEYLGGSISPGMQMRFRSLNTFTGKLPLITYKKGPVPQTGRDTESSIRSGVLNGMTAEMEATAGRYRKEYPELKVILSGGDLDYFAGRLKISIFALPEIVVAGLYEILRFNAQGI